MLGEWGGEWVIELYGADWYLINKPPQPCSPDIYRYLHFSQDSYKSLVYKQFSSTFKVFPALYIKM